MNLFPAEISKPKQNLHTQTVLQFIGCASVDIRQKEILRKKTKSKKAYGR